MSTVLQRRGLAWKLAWFYFFPTVRQSWRTLAHALKEGRLALQLPSAHVRFKLSGHLVGSTFFVTRARTVHIEIDEEPPALVSNFPRTLVYWKCSAHEHRHAGPVRIDRELAEIRGTGDLSEQEWNALQPILAGRYIPRKHPARATLNGIVRKMTTGTSWKKTQYETGNSAHASVIHANLARSGLWAEIVETLKRVGRAAQLP
ncbi:hypothetical protein DDK22_02005 [Cupriavidus necator]|uniref:Uncharacterized protein n=1 Tax=Cupriavidus necator TaxID=106590 RepID=A0A367PSI9_CUPNE|nr:hypothetical protein DDK22_02005 [Cupriavidus necator]